MKNALNIRIASMRNVYENQADIYVAFSKAPFKAPDTRCCTTYIQSAAQKQDFTGAAGSFFDLCGEKNGKAEHYYFVGLGDFDILPADQAREALRQAIGSVVRYLEKIRLSEIVLEIPSHPRINYQILVEEVCTTFAMARYHFDTYITDPKRKLSTIPMNVSLCACLGNSIEESSIQRADIIASGVNLARRWSDLPPSVLHPKTFSEDIQKELKDLDSLKIKVMEETEMQSLGMGGILGVCRGSEHKPHMVIVEYSSGNPKAPTLALVGKGVTFDTGGISIKPSENMEDMKADMAGAAAVMASMKVIGQLRPSINVIGCVPIVENMPSGTSIKPGDILTFFNGKTAEVKNTDAEGRLILADALSYISRQYNPDCMIDIATLTGACIVALGPVFAGLMSQDESQAQIIMRAGYACGDKSWQLPLHPEYRRAIDSEVADISNMGKGSYKSGAIVAGYFLREFVPTTIPWIHLDIAGVDMHVPGKTYYRSYGATGFGVKLFVELITRTEYHQQLFA